MHVCFFHCDRGCFGSGVDFPCASARFLCSSPAPLGTEFIYIYTLIWIGPTVLDLAFDRPQTVPGPSTRKAPLGSENHPRAAKSILYNDKMHNSFVWTNSTCQIIYELHLLTSIFKISVLLTVTCIWTIFVYIKALYQFNGVLSTKYIMCFCSVSLRAVAKIHLSSSTRFPL